MSRNPAPSYTQISNKISQFTGINGRIERQINKIGTAQDNEALHQTLSKLRDDALNACNEAKLAIDQLPKTPQRAQLARELQAQLKRFDSLSSTIKAKDTEANKKDSKAIGQQGGYSHFKDEYNKQGNNNGNNNDDDDDLASQLLLSQEQDVALDINQIAHRQEEIKKIENDVALLAEMFTDLQQLTYEQQEQLDQIETNLQTTYDNTVEAHSELEQAEDYQVRSSRKNTIIIALSVVALIMGVIAFIAWKTRKQN